MTTFSRIISQPGVTVSAALGVTRSQPTSVKSLTDVGLTQTETLKRGSAYLTTEYITSLADILFPS